MASLVKSKIASGDYATESEVICDGLRVLMASDRGMEHWLHGQVGPAHDALQADPSRALPIAEVRRRMAALNDSTASKA